LSMEYIGLAPEHGKAVFLVSAADVAALPGELKLPCARFGLLLAYDATVRAERLWETLGKLSTVANPARASSLILAAVALDTSIRSRSAATR
jgi:hypothetical protein